MPWGRYSRANAADAALLRSREGEGRREALYLLPLAGELPGAHRAEPEGAPARGRVSASGEGRPVRRRLQGAEPADGGADPDRWRCETVPVAGDTRISRREISGAAAVAGRPGGAGLGARLRPHKHRRLAPADRPPHPA